MFTVSWFWGPGTWAWAVGSVLFRRTGPRPGLRHSCPQGQHKLSLLFLGLTCCLLSLEWEPYVSRYANTLTSYSQVPVWGVSWRWFCITLGQSHSLTLKYGEQLYFVHFHVACFLVQTQQAKNCWKVLNTSWAQQAEGMYQPLKPPLGLDGASAWLRSHLAFVAASCSPLLLAVGRPESLEMLWRLCLWLWHLWTDPRHCSRISETSLS